MNIINKFIFTILLLGFVACNTGPKEIDFNSDTCDFCTMSIVDRPYGTELVTEKGKIYKFDSTECMLNYMQENSEQTYSHIMTCTMDNPGVLTDAQSAYYLVSPNLPSPMGANITAFSTRELAETSRNENEGEVYDFEGIKSVPIRHNTGH